MQESVAGMAMGAAQAMKPRRKQPVQMQVTQAENGWCVSVHGDGGTQVWIAADVTQLSVLVEQLAQEHEHQEHHV